jgi:hypothetical protein
MKISSEIISREMARDQKVTEQYLITLSDLYRDCKLKYVREIKANLNRLMEKK